MVKHGQGGVREGRTLRLRERLEEAFGGVDPDISLDRPMPSDDPSHAVGVLRRLATRGVVGDRYSIHECVGRGGMGVVLRVWDEDLRRHLAMKVMHGETPGVTPVRDPTPDAGMNVDSVDRLLADLRRHVGPSDNDAGAIPRGDFSKIRQFLEEAQITGQLDHPGIVPVHEVGLDDDGCVFFTMKLVKGDTLRDVLGRVRDGSKDWTRTRVIGLMLRVCEAMSYAHAKGVIHRDLKPSNVMVGGYGEVFVMDWGLACVVGRGASEIETVSIDTAFDEGDDPSVATPKEGRIVGTPVYMSPEQARGDATQITPAIDIYSVGAMLYHLVAGHPPYGKSSGDPARVILEKLRAGPPEPLNRLARDAPAELVAICEKAMARKATDRYGDMADLADDLRAYLEQRVVSAYETGAFAELRKWTARNRTFAATLVMLIASLVVGTVSLLVMSDELAEGNAALKDTLAHAEALGRDLEARNEDLNEALRLAEVEQAKVLSLLALAEIEGLTSEVDDLWPVSPSMIGRFDDWLRRAHVFEEKHAGGVAVAEFQEYLQSIRDRALPASQRELDDDSRQHPDYEEWVETRDGVIATEAALAQLPDISELSEDQARTVEEVQAQLEEARVLVGELEARVAVRRTFTFADPHDSLLHAQLERRLLAFEHLVDKDSGPIDGISRQFGWGVRERRERAARLEAESITGEEARHRWMEAIASMSDPLQCPAYGGWAPSPQLGLLPLWQNTDTGLWEFSHLLSGVQPKRSETGEIVLSPECGLVFILIPPGVAVIGAQSTDPEGRHYDPLAALDEQPVHEHTMPAYFLSKYEMTQGQWMRMTGHNPSYFAAGQFERRDLMRTLLHPVEDMNWFEARRILSWLDLRLPTEIEWEYAARAGTDTPWWTGRERNSLIGAVNIADRAARRWGAGYEAIAEWPELDDGYGTHAPVDFGRANPFGLHAIHGNVQEWCESAYLGSYDEELASRPGAMKRVMRGGAFYRGAASTRCSQRDDTSPDHEGNALGIRPARSVSEG